MCYKKSGRPGHDEESEVARLAEEDGTETVEVMTEETVVAKVEEVGEVEPNHMQQTVIVINQRAILRS